MRLRSNAGAPPPLMPWRAPGFRARGKATAGLHLWACSPGGDLLGGTFVCPNIRQTPNFSSQGKMVTLKRGVICKRSHYCRLRRSFCVLVRSDDSVDHRDADQFPVVADVRPSRAYVLDWRRTVRRGRAHLALCRKALRSTELARGHRTRGRTIPVAVLTHTWRQHREQN